MSSSMHVNIFIGYLINGEIKMHLQQSDEWNRSLMLNEKLLIEADWKEKKYLGLWVEPPLTYEFIQKKQQEVKSQLQLYCPKIKLDTHIFYLFPQIFIH